MDSKIEITFWRCVTLGGIVLDLWSSSLPGESVAIQPPLDKVVHCFAFSVLAFSMFLGAGAWRRQALIGVPLLIAIYAGLDEWHQSFVPGRSSSISDWSADVTGAVLAALGWWRARRQGGRTLD